MPLMSQTDIVASNDEKSERGKEVTDRVRLPGIDTLHNKPKEEIAEVLVNLMKSRNGITEMRWRIGEQFIELTYVAP